MTKHTFSLQTLLIVPFVLQVLGVTGLVGYFSYRSGQRTIESLADKLMEETGDLVTQDLNSYLQMGHRINASHIAALRSGAISGDDLDQLHQFLVLQFFENQSTTSFLFGSPEGDFRFVNRVFPEDDFGVNTSVATGELPYEVGYASAANPSEVKVFSVDEAGNLLRQAEIIRKVDVRQRPWYRAAVEKGRPGWSKPFQIGRSEILAINAFTPFYDEADQLQGVFSVNFSLRRLDEYLKALSISDNGLAFIVDRQGLIIANSLDQPAYIATQPTSSPEEGIFQPGLVEFERLSALESDNPIMRRTALQLQERFGHLQAIQSVQKLTVEIDKDRLFLRVIPYRGDYGLEWLIVTGIPESAFSGDIQDNARRTLLLCSLALAGAIGSGLWTAQRITRSLRRVTEATQNMARGDLDQPLYTSQIKEIETLAEAFRHMVEALRQGAELQKNYEQDLKQQVAAKTAALNEAQRIARLGSWTLTIETEMSTLSPQLCRIFGFDPQDTHHQYEDCLLRLHPNDRASVKSAIENAIATGQAYTVEYRVIRPDGSTRYVLGRGEAIKDQQGQVVKLIGTGLDITSQKQIELALQQSESRLRVITDSIPGCISYIDAHQRYRFVNQTYETWFQIHRDDILGRTVEEVIGSESYAMARRHIEMVLQGETVSYEMELPYRADQLRCVSGTLVPDFGEQGEVSGYYALTIDITERKKLERALRASEQKTQEIFNSALAAIASMRVFENGTWTIDRVSAGCQPLTGFTAEEMTLDDNLWIDRIVPEDWDAFREQAFVNIFAEQTATYEYRFRHKNGSLRWFSQITNSIWDEAQQCWIVTATSVDITDRKRAEEQLMAEFRLRQTIESSIVEGITTISLEGEQTYVNPAFCRMVGWRQEELLGAKPPFVYWPPEEVNRNTLALQDRLTSQEPVEGIELRFQRHSGERFDVLLLDAPLRDAQGNITARLASFYDITERKRAENALKQSETRFRDISDSSPANIYILVRRPDGTHYFEHMSQAIETICEVSVEAVSNNAEILLSNIHPDDLAGYHAAVQHSEERLEPFQYEWRVFTPSGRVKWLQGRSQPRWRENGELAWYGVVIDVTDRKRAELALQNSETRQRAILSVLPDLIYIIAADGTILEQITSKPEIDLYPADISKIDRNISELSPPALAQRKLEAIQQALATGEVQIFEQAITLNGRTQYEELRLVPMPGGKVLLLVHDISDRKQAELALRESEARFRQFAETVQEGFFIFETETCQYSYVNPAILNLIGTPQSPGPEEPPFARGMSHWFNHVHPDDRDRITVGLQGERQGRPFDEEYRFLNPDGRLLWLRSKAFPIQDETGKIVRVVGTVEDITERKSLEQKLRLELAERKQAEAALQERETLLRAVGDNLPKGFVYQFMHEPGKGFYFTYVSAGVERMVGLKPEDLVNKFNALEDLLLEEDRQLVERANQESLENLSLFEVNVRKRTLWGEIQWSTVRSSPYRLEDGRTVWYGIELDITNLKKAEAALRENEELFRRAFEDAPIGMALVSSEGRFLRINQALSQFLGYPIAELVQCHVSKVSHPEDMLADQKLTDQVLAGHINTYQMEKRYFHRQGHLVYGLLSVSLLRDAQQQPLYFVTQVQDISERRKIDQMKRDFVSIVSHELRTPLTSIRGSLGILASGVLQNRPEKAKHMMTVAIHNTDRLIRLVNDILNLERLESGKIALVKEPCHIGQLMADAVDSLEATIIDANVTVKVYPLDQVVPLEPDAILQTLTNLLSNAIKFSPAGSTVWLEARELEREEVRDWGSRGAREQDIERISWKTNANGVAGNGYHPPGTELTQNLAPQPAKTILFSVKDEGRGIPADKLDLIFDRFQQVDTSDSRQKGGTGLGLSICKNIVEQHGGTLWAESVEGQGSTFYFTIPYGSFGEVSPPFIDVDASL